VSGGDSDDIMASAAIVTPPDANSVHHLREAESFAPLVATE